MPSLVTRMKAHFGKNRLTDGSQGIITISSTGKGSRFFGKSPVAKEPLLNDDVLLNTNTSTEASAEHAEFVSAPTALDTSTTDKLDATTSARTNKTEKIVRFDTENIPVHIIEHPGDYHYDAKEKVQEMEHNRKVSKVKARCEGVCIDKKRRAEICGPQREKVQAKVHAAKVAENLFL